MNRRSNTDKTTKTRRGYIKGSALCPSAPSTKMLALGIDPGVAGAFALTDGTGFLKAWPMPLVVNGTDRTIDFDGVHELLSDLRDEFNFHIFLERAIPMAMGSKGAFNYGRGFAALEIAIQLIEIPVTYVEPAKWAKYMHEGLSTDLRPKAKSILALNRLYPKFVKILPTDTKGRLKDGPVDALLIAGYGIRRGLVGASKAGTAEADFF